jgi:hypothetical protein
MKDLISGLQERIRFHRKQLEVYQNALAAAQQDKSQPSSASKMLSRWAPEPREPTESPSFGGYPTRREYIKSLVLSHNGIDPSQIRDITRQAGIHVTGNYPYDQLKKLLGSGEVKLVNGQYFPREQNEGEPEPPPTVHLDGAAGSRLGHLGTRK